MTATNALESTARSRLHLSRFLLAFVIALGLTLIVGIALAFGFARAYDGRVLPGVRVGATDLSGLDRAAAVARLSSAYGYLAEGTITIKTPQGTATLTFKDAGRGPDVGAMADAALAVGRQADPVGDGVQMVRTAVGGTNVPLMVKLDPTALATRLRAATKASDVPPRDAFVKLGDSGYSVVPSVTGRGLDEKTVAGAIVSQLQRTDAPAEISVQAADITIAPTVSDAAAQAAIAAAGRMTGDLQLVLGSEKWTIPAATVRGLVGFSTLSGTYRATPDATAVRRAVSSLTAKINQAPVEPTILTDNTGKPYAATGAKNGRAVDVDGTTSNVVAYLASLEAGGTPASPQVVASVVEPKLNQSDLVKQLANMKKLGSWTVKFQLLDSNGYGANIRLPAKYINGSVVAPGAQFSFWRGVGPITTARGFKQGGVIINGHSQHTGAIGGGICSASTTLFNAALRAGLQIDERHNHAYYIARYPMGLDATVFQDGSQVSDMKFTNDTAYPIIIRGYSTSSSVTFEIWGVPDGRTVKVWNAQPTDYVYAKDTTVYVTSLPPGARNQAEYKTNGFNVWAYRTVKNAAGQVIHNDRYYSHYVKVDGVLQIGVASAPATPKPTTNPTKPPATATPPPSTPAPTATPAG